MSEHVWFQENLAGYIALGLSTEERERFDRHRIACSACARTLAESKGFDEAMENLFAEVRPAAGWENRVLQNLRAAPIRLGVYWSKWMRVAASVAALVVLGTLGAVLYGTVVHGNLAFPGDSSYAEAKPEAKNNLRTMLGGIKQKALKNQMNSPRLEEHFKSHMATEEKGSLGVDWMAKDQPESLQVELEAKLKQMDGEALGELDEATKITKWNLPQRPESEISGKIAQIPPAPHVPPGDVEVIRLKNANAVDAAKMLDEAFNSPKALAGGFGGGGFTANLGARTGAQRENRIHVRGDASSNALHVQASPLDMLTIRNLLEKQLDAGVSNSYAPLPSPRPESSSSVDDSPAVVTGSSLNSQSERVRVLALQPAINAANQDSNLKRSPYFTPLLPVTKLEPEKTRLQEEKRGENHELGLVARAGGKAKDAKAEPSKESAQPEPAPAAAPRKIIRTGEIEFEVDGFDTAVAGITRLVNGVPGGFITTVNSDKLPNGKVKGSLVVRLPPDKLDKFLLDVRQELGKTGELKSQRIGSQDVTKQYTDVESRLRGARAMEERFLQIIKTGKGEIKDLIVAENALGVWRTKIEEMEGEIRYYNNQVGLSTLTITLYEKEIQAPAALVVTERLKMQLEVEDVAKAQKAALAAVAEAKGRVTKSELKQHAAGQLEAILHFEVAPAAADKVRDRLKELGVVTHQDADRSQQTEGAGSRTPDIKIKQHDVKFEVGMYNVANVQPREVLVIQIASLDVPDGFRKLQEAVLKAKGQVRTGQLSEQDKLNVSAQFDFDIPTSEKKAIDQALAEVGKIISRNATQAAPGEAATDRKIGYRLALRNVAALPSREKISLGIEVKDVDQTAADILELVKGKQGHIAGAQMNHERNGRASAILVFDVPLSAKDELIRQVKNAGTVRLQTSTRNPQVPDNELATAHIDVTLTSTGPIVPSDEGLWPQIRTSLFYSFKLLSWSLMFVILGLSVILPWVLVIWGGYKLLGKWRKKPVYWLRRS